jgi:hypothetical protein
MVASRQFHPLLVVLLMNKPGTRMMEYFRCENKNPIVNRVNDGIDLDPALLCASGLNAIC